MEFKKLNLKKKIVFSGLFFICLVLFLLFFIIRPSLVDIRTMSLDVQRQTEDFNFFSSQGKDIEVVSNKMRKIKPEIDILNNIFIDEDRGLFFSDELEKIAEKNQTEANISLLSKDQASSEVYDIVKIKISGQGLYENLVSYLYDLERSIYYINIESLTISSKGDGLGTVGFTMTALTYWQK